PRSTPGAPGRSARYPSRVLGVNPRGLFRAARRVVNHFWCQSFDNDDKKPRIVEEAVRLLDGDLCETVQQLHVVVPPGRHRARHDGDLANSPESKLTRVERGKRGRAGQG